MTNNKKMNLPNTITVIRMFIVILIILIDQVYGIAWPTLFTLFYKEVALNQLLILILFVLGSISDFLDGYIARKYNIVTTFGKFLDPIADKLLVNVMYILMATHGAIPILVPIIFIIRDTFVDGIRLIASEQNVVIAASKWGKAKTVSQMVIMILVLLNVPYMYFISYIAAIISLISGIDYFIKNRHFLLKGDAK